MINDVYGLNNVQILKEFGIQMRAKRINNRLTQRELAQKAGVNSMTIAGMESGKNVSMATVLSVLRVLDELSIIQHLFLKKEPIRPAIMFKAERMNAKQQRQRVKKTKKMTNV